jgi:uncharacterized membrane protein
MIFDHQMDSQRVYDAIQSMRHSPILGLERAILVTRDSQGEISLYQRRDLPDAPGAKGADELGQIADALFGPDSEERGAALVKMGLDGRFVKGVTREMQAEKSALLALLRYDDVADRDELLRTLRLFKGQILQTTISSKIQGKEVQA